MKKFLTIFLLVVVVLGAVWFAWHFYWVFGEGVKAGQLNNFMKKVIEALPVMLWSPVKLLPPNSWQTAERNSNCIIKNIWAHCPGGAQRFISWIVYCP